MSKQGGRFYFGYMLQNIVYRKIYLHIILEFHDNHHLKFNQNFGVLGILDSLHGTDSMFRSSKQAERHYMLLTSTPAREMFPDEGVTPSCKKID